MTTSAPSTPRSLAGLLAPMALLLTAALTAAGCGDGHERHTPAVQADTVYTVDAVFLGPRFDSTAARVAHDDIPGVMPAMTMDLRVAERAVLRGHAEGDSVVLVLEQRGPDLVVAAMQPRTR